MPNTRDRWGSGIHFKLRGNDSRACLLVIVGLLPEATKESVALDDRVRESEQALYELLVRVRDRQGLAVGPWPAVSDSRLGFWNCHWPRSTLAISGSCPGSTRR